MIVRTPLGDLVIDDETGATTTDVAGLAFVANEATAAVSGGYREPWRWATEAIDAWAAREGVEVEAVDQPEPWPPLEPGEVGAPA